MGTGSDAEEGRRGRRQRLPARQLPGRNSRPVLYKDGSSSASEDDERADDSGGGWPGVVPCTDTTAHALQGQCDSALAARVLLHRCLSNKRSLVELTPLFTLNRAKWLTGPSWRCALRAVSPVKEEAPGRPRSTGGEAGRARRTLQAPKQQGGGKRSVQPKRAQLAAAGGAAAAEPDQATLDDSTAEVDPQLPPPQQGQPRRRLTRRGGQSGSGRSGLTIASRAATSSFADAEGVAAPRHLRGRPQSPLAACWTCRR